MTTRQKVKYKKIIVDGNTYKVIDETKLKSMYVFGEKVYLLHNLYKYTHSLRQNALSVSNVNGAIFVNPKELKKYPKKFQYFLIKWGQHMYKMGDAIAADRLALWDYMEKGFPKKYLVANLLKVFKKAKYNYGHDERIKSLVENFKIVNEWVKKNSKQGR